jgi:hypothetical protein
MTNSPAKNWVQSLGSGWYLPSIDELEILFQNRYIVNEALNSLGQTLLSYENYWSSTEYPGMTSTAFRFTFTDGHPSSQYRSNQLSCRAIRAF